MTYPTPAGPIDRELIINKSRFIAWLRPVQDRDQAQAVLEQARARYDHCRHRSSPDQGCPLHALSLRFVQQLAGYSGGSRTQAGASWRHPTR